MFFRMLCNDVLYFLVLLLFLLVAFAASWTVLLSGPASSLLPDPPSSSLLPDPLSFKLADHLDDELAYLAGCADELGGVDFFSTLLRLLEGALTGNDYFDCARNSTSSPVAAWVVTSVYVTLTAVLLLNMLIAMCAAATTHTAQSLSWMAKTFDNVSEASATNYLFLFTQRTLALQNEPPTPPPLNVVGLPCEAIRAMLQLQGWLRGRAAAAKKKKKKKKKADKNWSHTILLVAFVTRLRRRAQSAAAHSAAASRCTETEAAVAAAAPVEESQEKAETALSKKVSVELKVAAAANAAAGKSHSTEELPASEGEDASTVKTVAIEVVVVEAAEGAAAAGAAAAMEVEEAVDTKKKFAPLAEKITEYIIDHQDDAAQEDRWRTIMKRDMTKSFKKVDAGVQEVKAEVKAEVKKVKEEVEAGV
eukprot:scaffold5244_cov61-Phaeocystis_antarctica.AAC.3